jgi:hypothetical protein
LFDGYFVTISKRIVDVAAILAEAAKRAHLSLDTVNDVQMIRLDAEIKLGHLIGRAKESGELIPKNTLKRGPVVVTDDIRSSADRIFEQVDNADRSGPEQSVLALQTVGEGKK